MAVQLPPEIGWMTRGLATGVTGLVHSTSWLAVVCATEHFQGGGERCCRSCGMQSFVVSFHLSLTPEHSICVLVASLKVSLETLSRQRRNFIFRFSGQVDCL